MYFFIETFLCFKKKQCTSFCFYFMNSKLSNFTFCKHTNREKTVGLRRRHVLKVKAVKTLTCHLYLVSFKWQYFKGHVEDILQRNVE